MGGCYLTLTLAIKGPKVTDGSGGGGQGVTVGTGGGQIVMGGGQNVVAVGKRGGPSCLRSPRGAKERSLSCMGNGAECGRVGLGLAGGGVGSGVGSGWTGAPRTRVVVEERRRVRKADRQRRMLDVRKRCGGLGVLRKPKDVFLVLES